MISLPEYAGSAVRTVQVRAIAFDRKKFLAFKRAYKKALLGSIHPDGLKSFLFEGREIPLPFAKYMIEYLEIEFKRMKKP